MSRVVLVVEDELLMRTILRDNLEFEGYHVLAVESGEAAVQVAAEAWPDAVLLDVMLPGISGYEVCRQIRTMLPAIPIIIVTARNSAADHRSAREAGASEYVCKPFDVRDLIALVGVHLSRLPGLPA